MGQVIANASMSIDGYIAKHDTRSPLGDPIECVQGDRVTHLVFPVEQTMTSAAEPRA